MKDNPVTQRGYYAPHGGLPGQHELLSGRAVFTEAYAFIPRGVMTDIVTSALPFWEGTRAWIIARPLSGFAETFSQYIMEVAPGGGSDRPEPDPGAEGALFVVEGEHAADARGGRASTWSRAALPSSRRAATGRCATPGRRRRGSTGSARPMSRSRGSGCPRRWSPTSARSPPTPMPDTDGRWTTTRFLRP